jgi:predicted nucleic acid-binding protein
LSVVIDASVLVAAAVGSGASGEWAEELLAHGGLHAPELILVEATNILRRLERVKKITSAEAEAAHRDHMNLDLEVYAFAPVADRVWELRHTLTSYDAWYVAVAEALELPFATLDARLARASGPTCELVVPGQRPSSL